MSNEILRMDDVQSRIYILREVPVLLDKDLSIFYDVKTTRLREQVKRNIKRFPSDFMFQLTEEEVNFMVSQNAIPSKQYLGGSLPYVFTEQGVAMLSGVFHIGASLKDLGKKWFAFSKFEKDGFKLIEKLK